VERLGQVDRSISGLSADSRRDFSAAEGNEIFVAVKGTQVDGHRFIDGAIENGARVIICEQYPENIREDVSYIRVQEASEALALIAANFYERPGKSLRLIGVTGTNGKTTIATLLFRLFKSLGYPCGLISTVDYRIGEQVFQSTHTTPDAVRTHQLLAEMVEAGCEYAFMEVSSHALVQNRVLIEDFSGAIFSNISHDHLDYHGDFKSYIKAKKKFFDLLPSSAFALSNADDRNGMVMLQNTQARKKTYSLRGPASYRAKILENDFGGLQLDIDNRELHSLLIGEFNAYNLLAVYAAAMEMEASQDEVLQAISGLRPADGRFEQLRTKPGGVIGIVDYAHTPDALEKVLHTIRHIQAGASRLITVVGCGGDRDREKRPVMAQVAAELSDQVILTSDNPRSENPDAIIADMEKGIPVQKQNAVLSVTNRKEAIKAACKLAQKSDVVLIAGKGHEKYQEIQGERLPFDDKAILADILKSLDR
jgi:UDP-N-acetylmuramoyl-L-alanyl-D-glutamate--2,6-diaminopimelate ligase